ncbi:transporter associated domain-containing protein [Massilia sp. CFBP9012]|uniref:TerC family protein n=1 Tax=Massilia sp. CFBP9012 TaxID=3096531 RepID=UPI002A6A8FE8|nr:transporter associated domain-containing protein [Massilia sp. CFBP9012]MDY0974812.1 transporter associated domain-containing protein [Massilia sp. CFBP9012]
MEWLMDPNIWVGLLTLVVLEIVLGIDNLIFIAILADKLPPHQRDKARLLGLSLAMIMRLGLLTMISWLVTLTAPLFSIATLSFSGRDLILLIGGIFLLAKATIELHERVEGKSHVQSGKREYASFAAVVAQIIVLDAVFSLDAVITAVGMVEQLGVMMAAVIISMGVMLFASKPLTRFVNAHPTVVVLCLSFLLMIGLSLIAEGLGFHIPKGYLYAAIGFSVVIEFFNQLARRNFIKQEAHIPLRDRTADAVLRLLGSKRGADHHDEPEAEAKAAEEPAFEAEERNMVSGVLSLSQRSVRSIMTNRSDISWINIENDADSIRAQLLATPHGFFPVCRGQLDEVIGVARAKDLIADLTLHGAIDAAHIRTPIIMPDGSGVLKVMDRLKRSHGQLVIIADEYGTLQGLVTPIDILEAIAGEFPDEDEQPVVHALAPGRWRVDGSADLHYLEQVLEVDALVGDTDDYTSLAGLMLERFGTLPKVGDAVEIEGFRFEVAQVLERRIATVIVTRIEDGYDQPPEKS